MSSVSVKSAALAYLARGWSVIPMRSRSKQPMVRWEPYQHRLATPEEIEDWFRRWPDANVGIVTGRISGLIVLDVDPRHFGDDSLYGFERVYGPLPDTVEAITGSGGRHIYFAYPGRKVRNIVGLAPGLDIRGDGGVIVAPPSIHPSGRQYEWEISHDPETTSLAPMPRWLTKAIWTSSGTEGHTLDYWRDLVRDGVPEGRRNNTIASLAGHLLWHGVDLDMITELLVCWNAQRCRPPLDDEEVMRTVESIARTHLRSETH